MAARTHAQQFANHTLSRALASAPTALTSAIANGEATSALTALWQQAAADTAPIARMDPGKELACTLERSGLYTGLIITPPSPRVTGDPAAIVIIGRGDGISKLLGITIYVLELALAPKTDLPSFTISSRTPSDERSVSFGKGPLPDLRWFAEHAFDLYSGRMPSVTDHAGIPELPAWYWWYALDGASAMSLFADATEDDQRFAVVRKRPVLLMPEIADAGEVFLGTKAAQRLREMRVKLCRDPSVGPDWIALAQRLANSSYGSAPANAMKAIALVVEAGQNGALSIPQALEQEAQIRSRLVLLGVEPERNHAIAQQLYLAAQEANHGEQVARTRASAPLAPQDQLWAALFLDESDLPNAQRDESDETLASGEPTFLAHGGLRAGYTAWYSDETSPLAYINDARWVFRSAMGASYFLQAFASTFGEGLMPEGAPAIGDQTLAFSGEVDVGGVTRRTQVIVVRVGRVIARVQAIEGQHAVASRQILHAALVQPLAIKTVQRGRRGIAAYWLAVAYPTNTLAHLMHSPGHDAARLLDDHPMLAFSEMPSAIATLGDQYSAVARSLASFQAQVRAHRWATYRGAMRSLVRMLLDTDMGDPRVNIAHAHEIVCELGPLDPDPIWFQLDAECRARG